LAEINQQRRRLQTPCKVGGGGIYRKHRLLQPMHSNAATALIKKSFYIDKTTLWPTIFILDLLLQQTDNQDPV
jgi:hypothetical protein